MTIKENILIIICGKSPAVITETIWSLAQENIYPETIITITTTKGKKCLTQELFDTNNWETLKKQLNPPPNTLKFSNSDFCIRQLPSSDLSNLDDLITSENTLCAADFIMQTIRAFTENPDTNIIFSIAGGRKTMSIIASQAMSLLARENDKLCHVIVSPPFDNPSLEPKFYFPQKNLTHTFLNQTYNSQSANITLIYLPFIKIRHLFAKHFERLPGGFKQTINYANDNISSDIKIYLYPKQMLCHINNQIIKLNAFQFSLYWMLLERVKQKLPKISGLKQLHTEYMQFCKSIKMEEFPEFINFEYKSKYSDDLKRPVSDIKKKLFSLELSEKTIKTILPTINKGVYAVNISGKQIEIIDE